MKSPMLIGMLAMTTVAFAAPPVPLPAEQVAPNVYVQKSSHKYASAVMGWVAGADSVTLIGAPHPDLVERALADIAEHIGKPVKLAILTHVRQGEADSAKLLAEKGIAVLAPEGSQAVKDGGGAVQALGKSDLPQGLELIPLGRAVGPNDAAIFVTGPEVVFAGEVGVHGPRAELPGSDTRLWIEAIRKIEARKPKFMVPGFGTPGGPQQLSRLRRYLEELRRQIAFEISMVRPLEAMPDEVHIWPEWMVWMPYDHPTKEDIAHVYSELTAPNAPFNNHPFDPPDQRPKALCLVGDHVHEPGHFLEGLPSVFEEAGFDVRFTVDPKAITAENLAKVSLFVILRDGTSYADGLNAKETMWMTPDQEKAIKEFVDNGGGFLPLHNSTGLYPVNGPYIHTVGGLYDGHGPLERFTIYVVDPNHPVTQGVEPYEASDEQHTPIPETDKVHFILENKSDEGIVGKAGWVHEQGKGRVCYLANGHTRDSLQIPGFRKLMINAMNWCVRRDPPSAK